MKDVALHVETKPKMDAATEEALGLAGDDEPEPDISADEYRAALAEITEFEDFGPLFKSSPVATLTETETEYSVTYIKHIYANHCVVQFNLLNTLNDQILENVRVLFEDVDEEDVILIEAPILKYDEPSVAYT